MTYSYPQDTKEFRGERRSFQLLFYKLNVDVWVLSGSDRTDHGMDYEFEYIDGSEYRGYRMLSQVKSTECINKNDTHVRFDLNVKTATYAVAISQPFVLFVADIKGDRVYFECLQDYFIENDKALSSLERNKSSVRIKIPLSQVVTRECTYLEDIARRQYSFSNGIIRRTR